MTLWLAAVLAAAAVMVPRPRMARRRLTEVGGLQSSAAEPVRSSGAQILLVGAVVGSGVAALRLPVVLAALSGVVPVAVALVRRTRRAAAHRAACEAAVVEVTFALAAELRAGRTPPEALSAAAVTAGPLRGAMTTAAASVEVGSSAAIELEAASHLPGASKLRAVAAAWQVTEAAGGRVALVLERLGEGMDRDEALRQEMQAALAAPQATMMLLAALPVVGLGLGQAIGAHPFHLLLYRPLGWALLTGAAVLDGAGIAISRRITNWALR